MGFLNPLFLAAGLAIAIPLLIHLLHRQRVREFVFPALRYLKRTERDHASRIRLRQLIVLLLRIAAILLLALAGARPFLTGAGSAHPPTALAVVLDNSASSGAIIDDQRALDYLKGHARDAVARANDQDRIWIVRAGSPWEVATPGTREDALAVIEATQVSDALGDLTASVARATTLVSASDLPAQEVHLLSDLQATALGTAASDSVSIAASVPILVLRPDWSTPANGSVSDVLVGGGLAPIVGLPTDVTARVGGESNNGDTVATRLWIADEVRGAARATPGAEVVFPVPIVGGGVMSGFVERDPDALRSDDRRYFSTVVAPPPTVTLDGVPNAFVTDAIEVLVGSGRITRASGASDVLVSHEGQGIRSAGAVAPAWIIFPPADPTRLPALNQRLRSADVPWQLVEAPPTSGSRRAVAGDFPHELEEVEVHVAYRLESAGSPDTVIHASFENGEPWWISGRTATARYLIVGSPLDPEASNLPLSSLMIPMFEWALGTWAREGAGNPVLLAGERFAVPTGVTSMAGPDGTLVPLDDPSRGVVLERAGLYDLLGENGEGALGRVAVNVPSRESDLSPVSDRMAFEALGADAEIVAANDWTGRAFRARQGPEIWRPLLLGLLAVLVLESLLAASGRAEEEPTAAVA